MKHPLGGKQRWTGVAILHPFPSLLVTATFLSVVWIALHAMPSALLCLRLIGVMLPAQFAIGVVNDLADRNSDRIAQPWKPLVMGAISVPFAWFLSLVFVTVSLAVALSLGVPTLFWTGVGLAAGLGYDLGWKRSLFSWLPWALGFVALPATAFATVGRFPSAMISLTVIAAFLAVGLHCANALPDIDGDRATGIASFPARLGADRTRFSAMFFAVFAAISSMVALPRTGTTGLATLIGASSLILVAITLAVVGIRRPFPIQSVASAVFATLCLVAVA